MILVVLISLGTSLAANGLWYFLAVRPMQGREREMITELHRAHAEAESDRALSTANHRRLAKIIHVLEYVAEKEKEEKA